MQGRIASFGRENPNVFIVISALDFEAVLRLKTGSRLLPKWEN